MMSIYAPKLQKGDEIRVISPSRSLSVVKSDIYQEALDFFKSKQYLISFSSHGNEVEYADSASIASRLEDLHQAFTDTKVKAILTSIGGFNANQLLDDIDYSLIKKHPKIICGYSDATVILNAIYAKTGLITYYGPHFSSFGFKQNQDYTFEYFEKSLTSEYEYTVIPSQEAKKYYCIQSGECEGIIIGGNLCSLNLLQGTKFFPKTQNTVLFLEDDNIMGDYFVPEFERNLQSLLQVENINIVGVVFGRFAPDCKLTADVITQIIRNKKQLKNIPIVFNADFGHITPFFSFPIGGRAKIKTDAKQTIISISNHLSDTN